MRVRALSLRVAAGGLLTLAACGTDEPLSGADCRFTEARDGTVTLDCTDDSWVQAAGGGESGRRHVILFIGDGMHLEHEIATSRYLTGQDDGLVFHSFPYRNFVTTWDATTYNRYAWAAGAERYDPLDYDARYGYDPARGGAVPYPLGEVPDEGYFLDLLMAWPERPLSPAAPAPDAASAATALATGHKTRSGNIAWTANDAPGGALQTIAEWLRAERGASVGIVATVPFSSATPAAFFAHNQSAENISLNHKAADFEATPIAEEMVQVTRPEVVISAGYEGNQYLTDTLRAELADSAEYVFVQRASGTSGGPRITDAAARAAAEGKKLFGLFGGVGDSWEAPTPQHSPGAPTFAAQDDNPSLAEATRAALQVLGGNQHGFFLLVNAGDIHWANAAHDYRWMLGAMWQLTEAVEATVELVETNATLNWDNTLLVVSATHAGGYLRLDPEQRLGQGELPDTLTPQFSYSSAGPTNELVTVAARGAGAAQLGGLESWYGASGIVDQTQLHAAVQEASHSHGALNIILFLADGMQLAQEVASSRYLYGTDSGLPWQQADFDYHGWAATWNVETYNRHAYQARARPYVENSFEPRLGYDHIAGGSTPSFERVATDDGAAYFLSPLEGYSAIPGCKEPATGSASAVTALATGHKTEYGNLAWAEGDPEAGQLESITERLRLVKGAAVGVVTTVAFSHATPAGFVSHNVDRNDYLGIADEIIFRSQPDVVIGGGHPDFAGGYVYITQAGHNELRTSPAWVLAQRRPEADGGLALLTAAQAAVVERRRLFGLFGGANQGAFEPPIPVDAPANPAFTSATGENPSLAEAVVAALAVLAQNEHGFFLMVEQGDIDWANHANDYDWMIGTTSTLDAAVRSAIQFVDREDDALDWENTLLLVTSDHANSYMRLNENQRLAAGELPEELGDYVSYRTGNHTNELVMLYATGGGLSHSERGVFARYEGVMHPGLSMMDNTHVYHAMRDFLGL